MIGWDRPCWSSQSRTLCKTPYCDDLSTVLKFRYEQDKARFNTQDEIGLVGHLGLAIKAETPYCDAFCLRFLSFRYEQDKARFVDKGLVDLVGHQSLGDKTETPYCDVYKT